MNFAIDRIKFNTLKSHKMIDHMISSDIQLSALVIIIIVLQRCWTCWSPIDEGIVWYI